MASLQCRNLWGVPAQRPRLTGLARSHTQRVLQQQQQQPLQQHGQRQPCQQQPWRQHSRQRRQLALPRAAANNRGSAAGAAAGSCSDGIANSLPLEDAASSVVGGLQARLAAVASGLDALFRFTRPHTMLGTTVSVCSVSALALGPAGLTSTAVRALAQALSSALLMNVCIVGINQLSDIDIDRVNKPYLPLAAGDFSVAVGLAIVVATGAASLAIGAAAGSPPLLATLGGSLALGIVYSTDLPFLRWKRSPVLAAACILAVRAILVQLGFFFHMQLALAGPAGVASMASAAAVAGAPAAATGHLLFGALSAAAAAAGVTITRPIAFATAFMLLFSVVIALFKDIPDVAGDSQAGVRTMSVRLGPKRVFWACIAILEVAYAGAILFGLQSELMWSRVLTTAAHAALGALLLWRARRTDLTSSKDISRCYMFSWGLFYAEYLLLPLFR